MRLVAAALIVVASIGCSGNGAVNPLGTGGAGGSSGGAGGGAGNGGNGVDPAFVPVAPCTSESNYALGVTGIFVSGFSLGNQYEPACLKVQVGTSVRFSGDFASHPLAPSAVRGTLTANPITLTTAGSVVLFYFGSPGFYAFYCTAHGSDADGQGMSGVVWVE